MFKDDHKLFVKHEIQDGLRVDSSARKATYTQHGVITGCPECVRCVASVSLHD